MIVLNKIKSKNEGDDLILSSLLEIDENNFELAVRIKGLEWLKYAVTDRLDAFLWGVLPYAMRHGHDIKCKDKVSGKFLYNLNTQYIQTLSKYDPKLYNTNIQAEIRMMKFQMKERLLQGYHVELIVYIQLLKIINRNIRKNYL